MPTLASRTRPLVSALVALAALLPAGAAQAFSEDLCVQSNADGSRAIVNCLTAAECGPNAAEHTHCRVNLTYDAAKAIGNGRSVFHTDATFFIAQAVGLRSDVAYWLAAYDQAVDAQTYVPFDMYGNTSTIGAAYTTAKMNGWARTDPSTGGFTAHFPAVFTYTAAGKVRYPGAANPTYTVDGAHPHLDDAVSEGMLYHFRSWALANDTGRGSCINGFTAYDPALRSFFTGASCYRDASSVLTTQPQNVTRWITGWMPTLTVLNGLPLQFAAYSGNGIAQYVSAVRGQSNSYISQIKYDDEPSLQGILDASSGVMLTPAEPVTADLARMAIYLHILQDRISHAACGDASTVHEPDPSGYFSFLYSTEQCTQDLHATRHYEEIGFPPAALPERVYSALRYTWNELVAFAQAHPEYVATQYSPAQLAARRQSFVGTKSPYAPGKLVTDAISVSDGCQRAREMMRLLAQNGLAQMPGNDASELDLMCP